MGPSIIQKEKKYFKDNDQQFLNKRVSEELEKKEIKPSLPELSNFVSGREIILDNLLINIW